MATQEDKIALVREGRTEFEAVELGLQAQIESLQKLVDIFSRGVPMGMLSGRKAIRIIAKLQKLRGTLAEVNADVHDLHGEGTQIARDNEADEELTDGFVVFGGGGRG